MTTKTSPTDNLRHWDALGTTDRKHTKPFQRAGGFRGTAVRPIESVRRMTEHFGPCGVGWGMDKPTFKLVPAGEELMVYCTASIWYHDTADDRPSPNRCYAWGVGGDKVIVKQSRGLVSDDEAFKKAFTDALGNAMKHIGVAADVHMGLFDDSKYVQQTRKEFAKDPSSEAELIDRVSDDMVTLTRMRLKDAPQAAPEPVDEQLMERASHMAQAGSFSLRSFWGGLRPDQKKILKPVLDTHLKPIAEAADKAREPGRSEDGITMTLGTGLVSC